MEGWGFTTKLRPLSESIITHAQNNLPRKPLRFFDAAEGDPVAAHHFRAVESLGLEVWEPFARNNQVDFQQAGWAYRVGQQDYADVVDGRWHIRGGERGAAG